MNKEYKYRYVFEEGEKFLRERISKCLSRDSEAVLKKFLKHEAEAKDISAINLRLIKSLVNRNMMPKIIDFDRREKKMNKILFGYEPKKIIDRYNSDDLLEVFKVEFKLNIVGPKNLWNQFSRGVISGSKFLSSFKDKNSFDTFIKTFNHNEYTKAALPMLLSKEIFGFGFVLSCDFLKELGYREYPKPDTHLIKIFNGLGLSQSAEQYDVYKSVVEMSEVVKKDAYTVDKIFWLIGSGKFDPDDINRVVETGNRKKFIKRLS